MRAWVFETLVARVLEECSRRDGADLRWRDQISYPLDGPGILNVRPDLLLMDGPRVVAVADTKVQVARRQWLLAQRRRISAHHLLPALRPWNRASALCRRHVVGSSTARDSRDK